MFIKLIDLKGHKRKIKGTPSLFVELRGIISKVWGRSSKDIPIGYMDSDNELVSITDDDDWSVCVEEAEETQSHLPFRTITIRMIPEEGHTLPADSLNETQIINLEEADSVLCEFKKPELPPNPANLFSKTKAPVIVMGEKAEVKPVENSTQKLTGTKEEVLDISGAELNVSLVDMIRELVDTRVKEKISSFIEESSIDKKDKGTKKVHNGITCDGCAQSPITGLRYKYILRHDYDLCEECHLKDTSLEPVLVFRTPPIVHHSQTSLNCKKLKKAFGLKRRYSDEMEDQINKLPCHIRRC